MPTGQLQSVSQLRFWLFDRPLHPELFDIRHQHRINKPEYEVQIWLTPCAHVIGFHRERQSLLELIQAEPIELPERGRLLKTGVRGEKDHQCHNVPGIGYMVNYQLEQMNPAVYAKSHQDLMELSHRRGLFLPFPDRAAAGDLVPFSYVDYDAKPSQLHVFAYHAFPSECTLVKTQSIFELR